MTKFIDQLKDENILKLCLCFKEGDSTESRRGLDVKCTRTIDINVYLPHDCLFTGSSILHHFYNDYSYKHRIFAAEMHLNSNNINNKSFLQHMHIKTEYNNPSRQNQGQRCLPNSKTFFKTSDSARTCDCFWNTSPKN